MNRKIFGLVLLTLLILVLTVNLSRIKAVAGCGNILRESDEAEAVYRQELRDVLKEYGAKNAGINLSKGTADGETLEIDVCICLPSYIDFDDTETEDFLNALYAIDFGAENASVEFSFS